MKQKMKTILLILFSLILSEINYAQKGIDIKPYAGINNTLGNFKEFSKPGSNFGLATDYFLNSKFALGIDVNYQKNKFINPFDISSIPDDPTAYNITSLEDGSWTATTISFGPTYRIGMKKFTTDFYTKVGITMLKTPEAKTNIDFLNGTTPKDYFLLEEQNSSSLGITSGVRFNYAVSKNLSLFINPQYVYASNKIKYFTTDINPAFVNDAGQEFFDAGILQEQQPVEKEFNPSYFNLNFGINYSLEKTEKDIKKTKIPKTEITNDDVEEDKKQELIAIYPKNGSQFNEEKSLDKLKWKLLGNKIEKESYIIEIIHLDEYQRPKNTYLEYTNKRTISSDKIFKGKMPIGNFRWRVIEKTTGLTTQIRSFTNTSCVFNFNVNNLTIECLGYVGSDRKYKVCFDSNYSGSAGDLTYSNASSGLSVYDQSYGTLSYTLVGTNTSLITQLGTSTTTVSYCFETVVSNSVTDIGFALQGDDLDPSPVICMPGVSASTDLPPCLCDECDDINLTFGNFNITTNTTNPSIFKFDGSVNVNIPIYGIELQMTSFKYLATPSACSGGVTNVETSSVFLRAGSTINNSTSLQFYNESISGSPLSNNNASKNIKHVSNSPLTGNIPLVLNIGLPEPLQGLDASCCLIDYEVCFMAKIFYEDGTCKTCTYKKCFNFNNQ